MIFIPDSVFPVNDHGQAICPKCKHPVKSCSCPVAQKPKSAPEEQTIRIRLEKSGRHGKIVTVIEGLIGDDAALKSLAKMFKTKSGSGGTFYRNAHGGVIEIQGDHKDMAKAYFKKSV